MILLGAVVAHIAVGGAILGGDAAALVAAKTWGIQLEAVRRVGVVLYLVAILLGLASFAQILRFQAIRLCELPARHLAEQNEREPGPPRGRGLVAAGGRRWSPLRPRSR